MKTPCSNVRMPGAAGNGKVCREIVELVDLLPTLGELIDVDVPGNVDGRSFAPLLVEPTRPWKKAAFTVFGNSGQNRSVRTKRFRYVEWPGNKAVPTELYDLYQDPAEATNLADEPQYQEKRGELARLLKQRP